MSQKMYNCIILFNCQSNAFKHVTQICIFQMCYSCHLSWNVLVEQVLSNVADVEVGEGDEEGGGGEGGEEGGGGGGRLVKILS